MKRYLVLVFLFLLFSGMTCQGQNGVDFYDGTWSMCKYTDKNGVQKANLPFRTGGLPPGAGGTVDGVTIDCTPIPMRTQPKPESTEPKALS